LIRPPWLGRRRGPPGDLDIDDYQRLTPSRVDGLAGVTEVIVRPARVEFRSRGRCVVVHLAAIARWPRPALVRQLLARVGWHPRPLLVADRDSAGLPAGRFFRFYTNPPLTVCMPADEPVGLGGSCFARVQEVMQVGGFHTLNLGRPGVADRCGLRPLQVPGRGAVGAAAGPLDT
jgi:hypothetical protein